MTSLRSIHDEYIKTKDKIGKGCNGIIYKWKHRVTRREYAVKVLKNAKPNEKISNKLEAKLHYQLSICQNVVNVVDIFEEYVKSTKCIYIVMELMAGGDLFDHIIKNYNSPDYSEKKVAYLMYQICKALDFLHSRNIAHCDVKPENIMFASIKTNTLVKLGDMGFAEKIEMISKTKGYTSNFVAPEILDGNKFGKPVDMWALGVVLYFMLFCDYPFKKIHNDKEDVTPNMAILIQTAKYSIPIHPKVSNGAKDLISQLLQPRPEARLTIEEVMKNEWIQNRTRASEDQLKRSSSINKRELSAKKKQYAEASKENHKEISLIKFKDSAEEK